MTAAGSQNAFKVFLSKDSSLLKDVVQLRSSDIAPLMRRLEAAARNLAQVSSSVDPTRDEVHDFIAELVHCYVAVCENTRVSRGLEKILAAVWELYSCVELVKRMLVAELQSVLLHLSGKGEDLKKVSGMLEHSKLVRAEMVQFTPLLLEQLGHLFRKLLDPSPSDLSREDCEKLYYTVKVCLQLFQQSSAVRQQGWTWLKLLVAQHPDIITGERQPDLLAHIVNGLLAVLVRKNYAREVTLLAATAVSMILSASSVPEESAQGFFAVHSFLTDTTPLPKLTNLRLHLATVEDTQHVGHNRTAEIALLRSVLLGSSQDLLCCEVNPPNTLSQPTARSSPPNRPFLLSVFPLVCSLCDSGTEFQYLSFQLLSLWTQKLAACYTLLLDREKQGSLMGPNSVLLSEVLKRVWLNLDSPVDGVAEYVGETLKTLMAVWHTEVASGRSDFTQLAEELAVKSVQVPWYARSRYKPLCLLVPYIDTDKLLADNGKLKSELLDCMGASFLAALASDVYTAFLFSIRDKWRGEEQAKRWQKIWLPTVMAGLTSPDSLIRNKVCAYWLTSTLKTLPDTGPVIQRHLEDSLHAVGDHSGHSRLLFAWVAVCRIIRTTGELHLASLSDQLLTEAVYSDDEDICSEAMFLLSTTQKKAEPLGEVEIHLLQAALPHCLKVDSAPFRQKLVTSLRKVFVRIRDSCSTAVKRKLQATFVDPSLQFMDWLYRLVVNSMVPGTCFQRRRTCLDVLQAWLETIIFVEADGAKKGKAQAPTDVLIKYAESKGLWDFFCADNRTILLHCVIDGADEIQESAVHILSKYFLWTSDKGSHMTAPACPDLSNHLLHHGLRLCDSPRAYENHSGSLLINLVYEKFVREQGYHFQPLEQVVDRPSPLQEPGARFKGESARPKACASFFRDILLRRIESSLEASEVDVLLASKTSPTHGLLQALCKCLQSEQASPPLLDPEDWQTVLSHAIRLSTKTVALVLGILAEGQIGNCPSFAQMGIALEQLAADGAAEQEVTSSLSPEFQLLLSWCWLNLKESCTCLGTVAALGVPQKSGRGFVLAGDGVQQIGDAFLRVLTHCRHRGAIEGCRNGFLQFCTSLMLCHDPVLSSVPAGILNRVLSGLEKDEMTSSITRRSAGLPIVVQTIVQAEKRCKSSKLLQQAVSRLYGIASAPPSAQASQTQDQAPVHALNVLKAVFSDASLSGELLPHLGRVMELVIHCFESSSWAVRNAATQLVSTLVTSMFGQRNKASLSCNVMTLQEWSAHFPELLAFVSRKLEESLQGKGDVITAVQPSLFLVLTLLSSLGPAGESSQSHRLSASLRATVLNAVSSPVHYLRELSATAVVALTPLDMTESCVTELLVRLEAGPSCDRSSNSVHGTLMCLEKLLSSRTVSHRAAEEVVQHIVRNRKLVSATEQCPLLSAKCVDVLSKAVPNLPPDSSLKDQLVEILVDVVFSIPEGGLQLGRALLLTSAVSLLVSLWGSWPHPTAFSLREFASSCLNSDDVEVRSAIVDCLHLHDEILHDMEEKSLVNQLWQQLQRETDASCVVQISRLLVAYYLNRSSSDDLDSDLSQHDLDTVRSRFEKLANVQAALFPVEAVVLSRLVGCAEERVGQERLFSSLTAWSVRLAEFSRPCRNEDFRLAAAQALSLAGHSALSLCAASSGKCVDSVLPSVVETTLVLLEETDSDVRGVVSTFAGQLQWKAKEPKISHMNANLCSKVFLAYLCDEFGHCPTVVNLLVSKLFTPGELQASLSKLSQVRTHYLFEPEENTFFSEKIHQRLDIFRALSMSQAQIDGIRLVPDLLQELRTAIPDLCCCTEKELVYGVSGEAGVMAALSGLAMLLRLLTHLAGRGQGSGGEGQGERRQQLSAEVSTALADLLQIPNLHPALKTFLQPL